MLHMVKIYTKKGDEGQTSLFGGQRISKSDPRPEAFGTPDEGCAILGAAPRAGARRGRGVEQSTPAHTAGLESLIDERLAKIELPRAFIIPGSSSYIPALLDWARGGP